MEEEPKKGRNRSKTIGHAEGSHIASIVDSTDSNIWKRAYTELERAVEQKETQIAEVAELGRTLLERNKEAEDQIEELRKQDLEKAQMIQLLIEKLREVEEGRQSGSNSEKEKALDYIEQEYKNLQQKYINLQEYLNNVQEDHEAELSSVKKKEKQLSLENKELKDILDELTKQNEKHKNHIKELTSKEQDLIKSNTQLLNERNKEIDKTRDLESQLSIAQRRLSELQLKIQNKERENQDLKDQIEEYLVQATEIKTTYSSMERTVSQLIKTNHSLHQENEEINKELTEARQQIDNLARSKSSLDQELNGKVPQEESLFNQIQQVDGGKGVSLVQSPVTSVTPKAKSIEDSILSEHEYFFLAAAAVKIGLVLRFPLKSAEIMSIDIKKLYAQATKEHIPFHEWHQWITVQFGNAMYLPIGLYTLEKGNEVTTRSSNANPSVVTPTKSEDPKIAFLFRSNEETIFNEMEKKTVNMRPKFDLEDMKIDEMEKDMTWLNLESKSEKELITSLSPYPDWNCSLDNVKGKLYLTQNGIYFHATNKAHKHFRLPISHSEIESFRRAGPLAIFDRNSIYVRTKGDIKFMLSGFQNHETAFEVMNKFWSECHEDQKKKQAAEPKVPLKKSPSENSLIN